MEDVEAMLERRVLLLGYLDEVLEQGGFRNVEGLGEQDILAVGEETEGKLDEI